MLEGNEVEKKYDGEAGLAIVDIRIDGVIVLKNTYRKELAKGVTTDNSNGFEISVPMLLEALAEKTGNGVLKSLADVVESVLKIGAVAK